VEELASVCLTCSVDCPADAGPIHLFRSSEELFVKLERKQILMKSAPNILHPPGLAVHKETIDFSIASELAGFVWAIARQMPPHPPKA